MSGRSKSFDDLLKEHKATKEAILRAKAESQNAAAVASAAASANCVLVSPAAVSATMNSLKHEMTSVIVQQDGKFGSSAGLSGISRTSVLPSSVVPTAAAHFVKPANIFQRCVIFFMAVCDIYHCYVVFCIESVCESNQ